MEYLTGLVVVHSALEELESVVQRRLKVFGQDLLCAGDAAGNQMLENLLVVFKCPTGASGIVTRT